MKKDVKKFRNKNAICFLDFVNIYYSNIIYYYGPLNLCIETLKKALAKTKKKIRNTIIEEMQRYIGGPENTSDYFSISYDIDGSQWVFIHVGNRYKITDIFQLGSIMHECLHAAIFIARSRGVKDDNNGNEALVYLAESIYTNFLNYLQKYYTKGKNDDKNNKVRSKKRSRINQGNR